MHGAIVKIKKNSTCHRLQYQ